MALVHISVLLMVHHVPTFNPQFTQMTFLRFTFMRLYLKLVRNTWIYDVGEIHNLQTDQMLH